MQELKLSFERYGFFFEQVWRDEKFAIYRRNKIESKDYHYEVIVIQHYKAAEINYGGNVRSYPNRESYPNENTWGKFGFTLTTEKFAHEKVKLLKSKI